MGQNNKKYLDYAGLEKLVDLHAVVPHPQVTITEQGAYKLAFDEHGHITSKSPLTAGDLGLDNALHFVGVSTTDPLSATGATCAGHTGTYVAGDVCLYKRTKTAGDNNQGDFRDDTGSQTTEDKYEEYIYTGTEWELLGDADSYALKDVTISGDNTYITGGGDLSQNRTLSHKTYTTADPAIRAIGRDSGGHVNIGGEIFIQADGGHEHSHTTSTKIVKDTYVTGISPVTKKLSISPTKKTVLTGVGSSSSNLDVTQITPVSGSTIASKATAQTAKKIAKVGAPVRYGTADVGDSHLVAIAATDQSSFLTDVSAEAPSTTIYSKINNVAKDVYNAAVSNETLVLTPVTLSATTTAPNLVPTMGFVWGVADTVSVTSATTAPSTQTLIPAVDNGEIVPYTMENITVPVAASAVKVATGSVSVGGGGSAILTGLANITTVDAITAATITKGTSGDVEMLESVSASKNAEVTYTGSTSKHTENSHTHSLAVKN